MSKYQKNIAFSNKASVLKFEKLYKKAQKERGVSSIKDFIEDMMMEYDNTINRGEKLKKVEKPTEGNKRLNSAVDRASIIIDQIFKWNHKEEKQNTLNLLYPTQSVLERQFGINRNSAKKAIEMQKERIDKFFNKYEDNIKSNIKHRGVIMEKGEDKGKFKIVHEIKKYSKIM